MSQSSIKKSDRGSIKIERLIFHVLNKELEEPGYLDEMTLTDMEKDFFSKRIADACDGTQFFFQKEEDGEPKIVERVASRMIDDDNEFVSGSKQLAQAFLNFHKGKGGATNGVFLISVISIQKGGIPIKMIALMKVDDTRVLQFKTEGERTILREIQNTFVEDKSALQKTAILDVSDSYSWDVTAKERRRSDDVAGYFKAFLGVEVLSNDYTLTALTMDTVKTWFKSLPAGDIPVGESLSSYKERASSYCNTHVVFNTDTFIDMVICDGDEKRKGNFSDGLRNALEDVGVAGQEFSIDPKALSASRKSKARSSKNVMTTWEGSSQTRGIKFSEKKLSGKVVGYEMVISSEKPFVQD